MITITTVVVCFVTQKWKRSKSGDYIYTANLTYNIRREQIHVEDEGNDSNSGSRSTSTVPYYDYIVDDSLRPPRTESRERISSSSGSSDSMVQN